MMQFLFDKMLRYMDNNMRLPEYHIYKCLFEHLIQQQQIKGRPLGFVIRPWVFIPFQPKGLQLGWTLMLGDKPWLSFSIQIYSNVVEVRTLGKQTKFFYIRPGKPFLLQSCLAETAQNCCHKCKSTHFHNRVIAYCNIKISQTIIDLDI